MNASRHESKAGAMFCEHAKPRGGVEKSTSDGESIFVTDARAKRTSGPRNTVETQGTSIDRHQSQYCANGDREAKTVRKGGFRANITTCLQSLPKYSLLSQ